MLYRHVHKMKASSASNIFLRGQSARDMSQIRKLMAANRGEIATRIMRAGNELGIRTVGIFSAEDRFTQHRYKADESYLVGKGKSPVAAYLDIDSIINVAKDNHVDAVHPGYGFLSENVEFAKKCAANGITFVGPTPENLATFGDKTAARAIAIKHNVPVVPGTEGPVETLEQARAFIDSGVGYPVIIKASMGGGGKGMRVVTHAEELEDNFIRASSEALAAFGDGTVFIERYVYKPRHIEVQILGDGKGKVVHLFHRDCSVQRRHQKVLETAPAVLLNPETEKAMIDDAVRLTAAANYKNAGTVEFLVDQEGRHYFIEVNPRIQVEHTITEEITGVDLVQSQIRIANGESFESLGLVQDKIKVRGHAMQCRVTTENPALNFQPDSGVIEVFRSPGGMGIRLDDGPGFVGAHITPHYDSLLVKVTARALDRGDCARKLKRALKEFRVRGVTTNKNFLLNVLNHPDFVDGTIDTSFIADNPHLVAPSHSTNRGQKLLRYIGNTIVNGPEKALGATGPAPSSMDPLAPHFAEPAPSATKSLRQIYTSEGPAAFAKAVRNNKGLLLTDTTWRDAHQSLLATRVRTTDLEAIAPATAIALRNAYSIEMWGGATFDVTMRFLREDPWERLANLRELVPDVPFQMLLRGANAVGYTSYPDNVVYKFCEKAQQTGMDVFRVFDSLNYLENMRLGIDAVGASGGIIEAAVCYTGDVSDPERGPYNLEYYLNFTRQLVGLGIHVLAIKDMAGLLKPQAAQILIGAIRAEFPDLPIHVHTHDTAGTGVSSMLQAAYAGADAIDCATDAMSGTTSQPSMGAIVAALQNTELDTKVDAGMINEINDYWETMRGVYAPFESGQKSGSADVYHHEMPGGQYTNLLYQSTQLGLTGQWPAIKKAYATANKLLGDIIKVTPSSKVVGDFAQFLVQNNLTEEEVLAQAETLSFPKSVIEYFQGYLGIPHHGFPEELRAKVLKGKLLPNGKEMFEGRPGAEMAPYDFTAAHRQLCETYGSDNISELDVLSHAMYPDVFKGFMEFKDKYGSMHFLDTRTFLTGLEVDKEVELTIEHGKTVFVKLIAVGAVSKKDGTRDVIFELNGRQRVIKVNDDNAAVGKVERLKATVGMPGSVGAPMPGVIVEVKVAKGQTVKAGAPLCVLSAMKMETMVAAPVSGKIKNIHVIVGDNMKAGELLVEIDETGDKE
ncbi:pyruvate carboxylase [Saprolegnia diclina VS20]|uniref:Pyruvate carboxylase n=1 Tax=Saprolegnia diclina (strain VS20) TaxID=1156394 RepID=T0REQ9_SAPDV|nr:pyruvate carboxylase [Saprolegnia diclina VS20]EQC30773.1 pyruvate carboxylase [Saprolegnia diclina VS20]|eukprot:XP_008615797.1 pyruvate carboxylase [Saprolegnia diclina VS20]